MFNLRHATGLIVAILIAAPLSALAAERGSVFAERRMVSAANPLAAAAGLKILRRGGSAVDSAVAVQMVLNLVEPQSSGIGGGAFLLHFDAGSREISAYDGRETAPAAATEDLFLAPAGEPMGFFDALVGGRAVGALGVLRMLELAHEHHGKLPWADLFASAIDLAEQGFPVSPRLHMLISGDRYLATYPETRRYFFLDDGTALPVGHILKNPAFAETLHRIANGGADAFYEGSLARSIAFAVRTAGDNPGLLNETDIAAYEAKVRDPVCGRYRWHEVCSMPPPTSGGTTVLQILGILQNTNLADERPWSPRAAHYVAEASRIAFADRGMYLADPDFVDIPVDQLLSHRYLRQRYNQITDDRSMEAVAPGKFQQRSDLTAGATIELPSTTHFSIVDDDGNVVSMTSSIENVFGSRVMVGGFLLNNQLTDFSFRPQRDGVPVANRVEAGKRPRSSMSPVIILDARKRFRMATGSPGGSRIIGFVAKTIVGVIDWNLDVQSAIDLPNLVNRGPRTEIEADTFLADIESALVARGHQTRIVPMASGLHAIVADRTGYWGGADPRREGIALGD